MTSRGRENRNVVDDYAEDPERVLIAGKLWEAALSAAQVSEATGIPLTRVRRHLREMREEGLIETVITKSKRGTVEHFNFLVGGLTRTGEEWEELSTEEKRKLYAGLLKLILTEASRPLVTHQTDRGLERTDAEVMRVPIITDEAGWKELGDMHRDFCDRVLAARERISERLAEDGEKGFRTTSVLMIFESETAD